EIEFETLVDDRAPGAQPGREISLVIPVGLLRGPQTPPAQTLINHHICQYVGGDVAPAVEPGGHLLVVRGVVAVHHGAPPVARAISRAVRRCAAMAATSTHPPDSAASAASRSTALAGMT